MNPNEREKLAEQILDAALRQYSAVEPPPGLEHRLLARLDAAPVPRSSLFGMPRLMWAAAACLLIALFAGLLWHRREPIAARNIASNAAPAPDRHQTTAATRAPLAIATPPTTHPHVAPAVTAAAPHLNQFPRPAPLSEQDRLLLLYIESTPRTEVLETNARLAAQREADLQRFISDAAPADHAGDAQ